MATKDRTALKNDFANGKYATGEKFADLIDSMKVVQLPVVDPQALGASLSFIDSISQDADGKITATKKTLDLANAHELNPFKGWWKTGDTLPTSGFDGAYLYFKDTTEQTGLTTIYRWNGTAYADTGTVVDTSNVQTFKTGQAVNDVKIKDEKGEEVTGNTDVLSALAGAALKEGLDEVKQQVVLSETVNITLDSPYFVETINDAYVFNKTITRNAYTSAYNVSLFRLPAGKYKVTKTTSRTTNFGSIVAEFASINDFVVGGEASEIILAASGTSQGDTVDLDLNAETLISLTHYSNINSFASIEEIVLHPLKEKVTENSEALEQKQNTLISGVNIKTINDESLLGDGNITIIEPPVINNLTTGGTTNALSAEMGKELNTYSRNTEMVVLDNTSPYFVSNISDVYVLATNKKITTSTVGGYAVTLFLLPAGNYRVTYHRNSTAAIAYLSTISNEESFVVGGEVDTIIVRGDTAVIDEPIYISFSENTYVVLGHYPSDYDLWCELSEVTENIVTVKEKVEELDESLDEILGRNLDIVIPNTVYAIVGTELNIWNDTVSLSIDKGLMSPMNYQIRWSCSKGLVTDRCFRFKPTVSDVGNVSCTCYIYDVSGKLVSSKTFTIKVLANDVLNSVKNIVYFGDSLGGSAATALYDDFHDSNRFGGTIPNMLGTKGSTKHYEAVGGYRWSSYATAGSTGFRIFVSGVSSMQIGAVYSDGSHHFEIIEINIIEGTGNCLLAQYYTNPGALIMPSGTLTKVSGSGDSTVPYTDAFQESVNPLWNDTTQQLDINQYKQTLVSLGQLSSVNDKIDAVSFQFGVNESFSTLNLDSIRTYISNLYNCFVGDNSNCIFIVGLTTSSGNDVNGLGANYGATQNYKMFLENVYKLKKFYLTLVGSEFPNLRIATPNLYLDRYYGYAFGTRQISDRYTTTEQYHTNYVHPTTSGYNQIADAYLACYVGVLSE